VKLSEAQAILEVSELTTQAVKQAFRSKCMECHPDKGGKPEDLMLVKQAYDRLRKAIPCEVCGGTGFTYKQQGFSTLKSKCYACNGKGKASD